MLFAAIFSFAQFFFSPFLRALPAFSTILPFYLVAFSLFLKAPKTVFLPLKHHFLGCILPLSAMFLKVLRGFVYTITAYFYAIRLAFTSILPCV